MNRRTWLAKAGAASAALLAAPLAIRDAVARTPDGRRLRGDQPVRLSHNENPFGPSPHARAAMTEAFDDGCRYPHGEMLTKLTGLIAERENVPIDHVHLACGSGEILAMAGMAYGNPGGDIVAAHPTYEGLFGYARTSGATIRQVPLNDAMAHDLEGMERHVSASTGLVYVCNPNNPTGTIVVPDELRAFCWSVESRSVVLVDEAYIDLLAEPEKHSMVDLVRAGANVIIARTFSKIHGLAGLRIGYALAHPDILNWLRPFGMGGPNVLGLRAAYASLQDLDFQRWSRERVVAGRRVLYGLFDELGYEYTPSFANFVLFRTGVPINEFRARLLELGVQVARPFPPFEEWCRVTVGTPTDLDAFASALRLVRSERD